MGDDEGQEYPDKTKSVSSKTEAQDSNYARQKRLFMDVDEGEYPDKTTFISSKSEVPDSDYSRQKRLFMDKDDEQEYPDKTKSVSSKSGVQDSDYLQQERIFASNGREIHESEGATRDHDTQWPEEHSMDYPENANSLKRLVDLRNRVRSLSKRLDEAFEKYHSEKATRGEPQLPK